MFANRIAQQFQQFNANNKLPAGRFYIKSADSGLYLDAKGAGKSNGTDVIVWTKHGDPNQQWDLDVDGTIRNVGSGLVMDVKGGKGPDVLIWQKNGGVNQQWRWHPNGHIISEVKGHYLDVKGGSKSKGTTVIVWESNGGANQKWQLEPVQ